MAMGTMINMMEIMSRINPARKARNRKASNVANGDRFAAEIKSETALMPPRAMNTPE